MSGVNSVYSISSLLMTGIAALVGGLCVGMLLSRRLSPDLRKQRELERSLDRLLQQQKDYQHGVAEHFTDTSKLLGRLAESYRDVHNHLATGAGALCDDEGGSILRRIPDDSLAEPGTNPELEAVEPPRDYAPKPSPHATGVLNEEFGLDKKPEEALDIEEIVVPKEARTSE
jgi:uncharacterized membrane-anchored protein YhcB (DUF1043 family)